MRRPSGDHADWASSGRASVSWRCGRPNDGITKMSPLSGVSKRLELNDSQPLSPGQDACADVGAMAAAAPRTARERMRRRRRHAAEWPGMEAPSERERRVSLERGCGEKVPRLR